MKGFLLDYGCGVKPYRELFNVDNYIGLDIKEPESKHIISNVDIIFDGKTIPFADNSFDSIFTSEVLEHIFEIDYTLSELYRVLKKSSYIVMTLPFIMEEHEIPYDFARYTSFGIRYLLVKHGFEIVHMEKTTNYIETMIQLWNIFLFGHVFPKNEILQKFLTFLFISPFNVLGAILGAIISKRGTFYHNNLVVARKT
jgi:SAM-dependent methyltransferase